VGDRRRPARRLPVPARRQPGLRPVVDVFNLFDTQEVLDYDNYTESQFLVRNPDVGRVIAYQTPREVRLGLRFGW